eukprot:1630343-Rhodomonas_salina.2
MPGTDFVLPAPVIFSDSLPPLPYSTCWPLLQKEMLQEELLLLLLLLLLRYDPRVTFSAVAKDKVLVSPMIRCSWRGIHHDKRPESIQGLGEV